MEIQFQFKDNWNKDVAEQHVSSIGYLRKTKNYQKKFNCAIIIFLNFAAFYLLALPRIFYLWQ